VLELPHAAVTPAPLRRRAEALVLAYDAEEARSAAQRHTLRHMHTFLALRGVQR
jgi:hypothetical protein